MATKSRTKRAPTKKQVASNSMALTNGVASAAPIKPLRLSQHIAALKAAIHLLGKDEAKKIIDLL